MKSGISFILRTQLLTYSALQALVAPAAGGRWIGQCGPSTWKLKKNQKSSRGGLTGPSRGSALTGRRLPGASVWIQRAGCGLISDACHDLRGAADRLGLGCGQAVSRACSPAGGHGEPRGGRRTPGSLGELPLLCLPALFTPGVGPGSVYTARVPRPEACTSTFWLHDSR